MTRIRHSIRERARLAAIRRRDLLRLADFRASGQGGSVDELEETLPDVRDGLTRRERIVLRVLHDTQKERGDRDVPTTMLWGRVCEHFYLSAEALSEMLARLGARK